MATFTSWEPNRQNVLVGRQRAGLMEPYVAEDRTVVFGHQDVLDSRVGIEERRVRLWRGARGHV